jgi:A/G-specific adenine glycosylase
LRPEPFAQRVAAWQRAHGRHDLPWQGSRDPYRRWLSEIMLQQTQVAAVVPYYLRFLERFPDVQALAAADLDDVLQAWSGLGYYGRARNLHAAARLVVARDGFPRSAAELAGLPGIGRSTAAAIAVFAFGERAAILDGNVKRVLCRHRGIEGFPGLPAVERRLWEIAAGELPEAADVEAYTQGLMDLGATVCTRARPRCAACPVAGDCVALAEGRVATLPAPRPRRELALRESTMVVLACEAGVLVERRPPAGVWGGLWSLPEADEQGAAGLAAAFGLRLVELRPLEPFVHAFTHFRLRIRPLLARAAPDDALPRAPRADEDAARRWLGAAQVDGAALPSPVKSLLQALAADGLLS